MKKIKNLWLCIPKPCRAALNVICIFVLSVAFYYFLGAPVLSDSQAFRRAERANFVGPSEILYSSSIYGHVYDRTMVAETEAGVITYIRCNRRDNVWDELQYIPKTGKITVVSAPLTFPHHLTDYPPSLPVFIVDEYPEAKRAELDIHITGSYSYNLNGKDYTQPLNQKFSLAARREKKGCFRFTIEATGSDSQRKEIAFAMDVLSYTYSSDYWTMAEDAVITATIRLYDRDGNLIIQQEQILQYNQ